MLVDILAIILVILLTLFAAAFIAAAIPTTKAILAIRRGYRMARAEAQAMTEAERKLKHEKLQRELAEILNRLNSRN